MILQVVAVGCCVLAPDIIGFGLSDKPTRKIAYSYAGHVAWMREWLEAVGAQGVLLACQDWGSLIGLRLVAAMPDRFAGVVLSNGGLPEGQEAPKAFAARSEEHTSELQSLMRTSYAVFCLKKKKHTKQHQ